MEVEAGLQRRTGHAHIHGAAVACGTADRNQESKANIDGFANAARTTAAAADGLSADRVRARPQRQDRRRICYIDLASVAG